MRPELIFELWQRVEWAGERHETGTDTVVAIQERNEQREKRRTRTRETVVDGLGPREER